LNIFFERRLGHDAWDTFGDHRFPRSGRSDDQKEIFILTFTVRYFHLNFRPSEKDTGFLL
jgi:hypothetical protein